MSECQELEKATTEAINAYCRVLELHVKAVEQGADPRMDGVRLKKTVQEAEEGLEREVQFLRFLREKTHEGTGSQGEM
jgi:hypothetical protein